MRKKFSILALFAIFSFLSFICLGQNQNHNSSSQHKKDQHHYEDESIPKAHLHLKFLKKKHYAPMPVELYASKSKAAKGMTIVLYEFDFGDGQAKKIISKTKINHIYEILSNKSRQKFIVSLRVQDNSGKWSRPYKQNLELKQIPDPGEKGKQTLEGIDLDEDGVRDDIQLYISQEFKDELPVLREALRRSAIAITKNLMSYQDKVQNIKDNHKALDSLLCVSYFESKVKDIGLRVYGKMINTQLRVQAETATDKNFNGETRRMKQFEDMSKRCDFNIDQF